MRSEQPLPFREDMGIMAKKGCSVFLRAPELEPHHQMHFSVRAPLF